MRFVIIKDLKRDRSMRPMINYILAFTLLFLVFTPIVLYTSIGLDESKIHTTFFGNEEEFIDPITPQAFLEFVHTQIFLVMMSMLTLSAVFARVVQSLHVTAILCIVNSFALLQFVFLLFSYYLYESMIIVYLGSFYIWMAGALFMNISTFLELNRAKKL